MHAMGTQLPISASSALLSCQLERCFTTACRMRSTGAPPAPGTGALIPPAAGLRRNDGGQGQQATEREQRHAVNMHEPISG